MTRVSGRRRHLLAAAAVLSLSACGGSGQTSDQGAEQESEHESEQESEQESEEVGDAAADTSTCAADATAAPTPPVARFPQGWPFPPESVVFSVEDRGDLGTIVTAVTTAEFSAVLDHMNTEVVGAGFATVEGETEEHDAEATWEGNDFRGRWAIRESASCPGETVVQVLAAPGEE